MRKRREYLQILEKAIAAIESAIDAFNRVKYPYRNETTLLLMSNAWELLAKAMLVKKHISIRKDRHGNTIPAEDAVSKLVHHNVLKEGQDDLIQQIISLRNFAAHYVLPAVPNEIMHHLLFFGCKFFREIIKETFPAKEKHMESNYLSLSFSNLTTYADQVQKIVSKMKRNKADRRLIWLLERGIKYESGTYISQAQFERQYRGKKRIMPYLAISDFMKASEMVRIVPVQAPKNYTADISLRKGSSSDASLPVQIKKTDLENDYPFLTGELASQVGKKPSFIASTIKFLGLKGNRNYHQSIRSSRNSTIQRYSQSALERVKQYLMDNPDFNPYKAGKSGNA